MSEGYKAWSGGQVLDAADLTNFASSQAVMRFANAAARDAALTVSVVKEGMVAYLKDTNVVTVNTDGTTTGWVQAFPVVTATISDGQVTNAKLAANSVTTGNIVDGTITGTDIAAGTIAGANIASGTITGANIAAGTITGANIQDGSIGASDLAAGTYGIDISGTAAVASNAALLNGAGSDVNSNASTIALRTSGGALNAANFVSTAGTLFQFYSSGTHTYLGLGCARVVNATDVFSQAISGGRTVLVNSSLTLGTSTSSRDHKEDIVPLEYALEDVLGLVPVCYRYKAEHVEPGAARPYEIGLIAEDVDAAGLEELLYRDKDGKPDGIAYEKLSVALLSVCRDQQTQIDALVARLDALEASHAD